jgi:hypothetical protein
MIDPVEFGKQMGALIRESADELKALIAAQAKEIAEIREALAATESLDVGEVVAQVLQTDGLKSLVDLQAAESVVNYFTENPVQHGKDGTNGADGKDGVGIKSILIDDVGRLVITKTDDQRLDLGNIVGKDGTDGSAGSNGSDGADGIGLASAMIDREGELILTTTKGETVRLGKVLGKDGEKGQDGRDGTDLAEVEFDYDGERGLVIRGIRGEIVKHLPIPLDRGYWREGLKAEKGDVYTEDGSAWIALKATDKKPSVGNTEDWRMFARRGRDGRQGEPGKEYVPPAPVKLVNSDG